MTDLGLAMVVVVLVRPLFEVLLPGFLLAVGVAEDEDAIGAKNDAMEELRPGAEGYNRPGVSL